jgi:hypothetical protein
VRQREPSEVAVRLRQGAAGFHCPADVSTTLEPAIGRDANCARIARSAPHEYALAYGPVEGRGRGAPNARYVRPAQASFSAARPLGIGTRNHRDAASDGDRLRPNSYTR